MVDNVTVVNVTVGSATGNNAIARTATIDTLAIDYRQSISVHSSSVAIESAIICPGQPPVVFPSKM